MSRTKAQYSPLPISPRLYSMGLKEDFITACTHKVGRRFAHGGWGTGGYDCCTLIAASYEEVTGKDTGLRGMPINDSDCIPGILDEWGTIRLSGEILLMRFPQGYHLGVLDDTGMVIHASEIRRRVIKHRLTPRMRETSIARYTLFNKGQERNG